MKEQYARCIVMILGGGFDRNNFVKTGIYSTIGWRRMEVYGTIIHVGLDLDVVRFSTNMEINIFGDMV